MKLTICVAVLCLSSYASAQIAPAPATLFGLHIGQPAAQVQAALAGHATFQREEERQQIWQVVDDPAMQYLIIGFDRDRQVRYVTALAKQDGTAMHCAPLGDQATATKSISSGAIELRKDLEEAGQDLTIIARGSSPDHLASCSIKKRGVVEDPDEAEQEHREQKLKNP